MRFNGTVSTETDHIVTVQFTRTQYIAYSLQSNPARYYRTIEVSHRGSFLSDVPAYLCSQTILFFICRAHSCVTHKIADYHNKWQINERTSVYSKDPWNLLKQIALKGFLKKSLDFFQLNFKIMKINSRYTSICFLHLSFKYIGLFLNLPLNEMKKKLSA